MENKRYTISVVVPVYNVEKYLQRCIESILVQSQPAKEIILVDDGSPDNSPAICDTYLRSHPEISVIHKQNGGLSSARLAGFKAATSDLIVFIDSDDYIHPDYLAKLSAPFYCEESVELSMCGYATDKGSHISYCYLPYQTDKITRDYIANDYTLPLIGPLNEQDKINIPGFVPIRMYRRALLQESDFVSEREYFTEDVLMNILYATRIQGNIAIVKEPLYYYCVNPGSLTLKYREDVFSMLMARYNFCKDILQGIKIDPLQLKLRLDGNLTAAVTRSVYNIGRIRNYNHFKIELKRIFNQPNVKELFNNRNWPKKATWHKIIYYTYHTNAYFLLYKILRIRKVI